MEKLFTLLQDLEIKTDSNKAPGYFKGYGATFSNKDLGDDIILPGAFDTTVEEHTKGDTVPAMFYEHNREEPIGDYLSMSVDKKGLLVEGQLWVGQGIPRADQAYKMLQSKTGKGLSIGYSHITPPIFTEKNKARQLTSLRVHEISPTGMPMNPKAKIITMKSILEEKKILTVRDAEDFLRDAGGMSASDAKSFIAALKSGLTAEWDAAQKRAQDLDAALANIRRLTHIA
jgi:uncharacterized protein